MTRSPGADVPPRDASAHEAPASYGAAVTALAERGRFGIRLGLGRTKALLRELGNPERAVRGALIAGTNGKGSVLALAGAALQAAELRAGETPKPHLVSYRERLQIAGEPISPEAFTRLVRLVLPAADRVARRLGEPTEFELLTAMLFRWFADEDVQLAIIEVGLGGRLDATHAWDGGVAAITNVALDHMAQLGDTIPKIAREKAAIIEWGDVAVTGASGEALPVVRRRARRMGVRLREVSPAPILGIDRDGLEVELPGLGRTRVGLRGRHQAANVAVADAVLDALQEAGIANVPAAARREGYAAARWPGRLELLEVDGHDVLLDGAHNPAGAAALATALDDLRPHLRPPEGPLTLVLGAMADKDVEGIAASLSSSAALRAARIIATRVDLPRALDPEDLAGIAMRASEGAGRDWRVEVRPVLDEAFAAALDASGPIVVAGSLYLVGEARRRWLDDPRLRDPEPEAAT